MKGWPGAGGLSIRLRILLVGAFGMMLALVLAAWGLAMLFDRHIARVAAGDLTDRLEHLVSAVDIAQRGAPVLSRPLSDPLYQRPYSGRYWQIEASDTKLRSRSLWDFELDLPPQVYEVGQSSIMGPQGDTLLVVARRVMVAGPAGDRPLSVAVAISRAQIDAARVGFLADLAPYLGLLALMLLATLAGTVTIALRPLSAIGQRVAALVAGEERRVGVQVPLEVLPLAVEIDALLDARDAEVVRARLRAGDLAHGLKTPMQALLGEAARLQAAGATEAARGIEDITNAMRNHVDHEITRARLIDTRLNRARTKASCHPAEVAAVVAGVLRRTPRGADLTIDLDCLDDLMVPLERADLAEALGALTENAVRHAKTRVLIRCARAGAQVLITVRDDGKGVAPTLLESLPGRGLRLDQREGGSGLGLVIASEIAAAVGGILLLRNLDEGFEAEMTLPSTSGVLGNFHSN